MEFSEDLIGDKDKSEPPNKTPTNADDKEKSKRSDKKPTNADDKEKSKSQNKKPITEDDKEKSKSQNNSAKSENRSQPDKTNSDQTPFPLFPTILQVKNYDPKSKNEICDPGEISYKVRGVDYLQTSNKIESGPSLYQMIGADFVFVDDDGYGIFKSSEHPLLSFAKARDRGFRPFVFIINFAMSLGNLVVYWTPKRTKENKNIDENSYLTGNANFDGLLENLIKGDNTERDSRLKVIPCLVQGNWVLSKVITGKPAIICQKIPSEWYVDLDPSKNFIEVTVNVSKSSVAEGILRLTKMYSNYVTLDLAFTLEGKKPEELPEKILCAMRINKIDMEFGVTIEQLRKDRDKNKKTHLQSNGFHHQTQNVIKTKSKSESSLINIM